VPFYLLRNYLFSGGFCFMSDDEMKSDGGDIVPAVIDFNKMRDDDGEINESWILTFGSTLRWLMPSLFRGGNLPINIRGTKSQVGNFANVLSKEKRYLQSWKSTGLDSPVTYKNKGKLDSAISKFERATGLKWPFK